MIKRSDLFFLSYKYCFKMVVVVVLFFAIASRLDAPQWNVVVIIIYYYYCNLRIENTPLLSVTR